MLEKHMCHDASGAEVVVVANDDWRNGFAVHAAERGENHSDAESDETETTDGGEDVFAKHVVIVVLHLLKHGIELVFLGFGKRKTDWMGVLKSLVKLKKLLPELIEILVERLFFLKDIAPRENEVHLVEHETAEQTVFGVVYQRCDLARSARENGRQARAFKLDKLTVFAASVGDKLVMECLAETIGEIAIVGLKGVGKGVAFGLENETYAVVVVQHLIDSSGAAVARNQKRFDGRLDRLLVVFLVEHILILLTLELFHFQRVKLLEVIMNGLDKMPA